MCGDNMRHFQLCIGIPSTFLTSRAHQDFTLEHPKLQGQLTMQRAVPCGEVMPKSDQSPSVLRTSRRQLMFRSCDGWCCVADGAGYLTRASIKTMNSSLGYADGSLSSTSDDVLTHRKGREHCETHDVCPAHRELIVTATKQRLSVAATFVHNIAKASEIALLTSMLPCEA